MNSLPEGPSPLNAATTGVDQNYIAPQTADHHVGDVETVNNDRGNEPSPHADVSMMDVDAERGSEGEEEGAEPDHIALPSFRFDEDSDGEMNRLEL